VRDEAQQLSWRSAPGCGAAVGHRHLGDHAGQPVQLSREAKRVPATVGGPPQHDPLNTGQSAGKRDRRPPIVQLRCDVDDLTRLAGALTKAPIVKGDNIVPGRGEAPGEAVQTHLLDRAQPVSHHHARSAALRPVTPGGALTVPRREPRHLASRSRRSHSSFLRDGGGLRLACLWHLDLLA